MISGVIYAPCSRLKSARSTAASAWIAVVSNSGTGLSSGQTKSMISVQPKMTASAPRFTRRAITPR